MSTFKRMALVAGTLLLAQPASAALFELINATDPVASYNATTGVLTSLDAGLGNAIITPGTSLPGSLGSEDELFIEIQLGSGGEELFTIGTAFEATPPAGTPEIVILDSLGTPLLTADFLGATVSGFSPGPAGQATTSVTIGTLSAFNSHLELTGGTLAGDFGGIGAIGELYVLLNNPTTEFAFGSFFDEDFTAQMNVQLQFHSPEPGTGLLVGLPIAGLAWWRRRTLAARRTRG